MVIKRLLAARDAQVAKHGNNTPSSTSMHYGTKLAILTEEVGEVARELQEVGGARRERLQEELMDVMCVAYAWLLSLE